jgi:hypothetical protein
MGAALIRKCWDVQEENWGTNENESTDNISDTDFHFQYQFKNNSNINSIQRQSI